MRLNGQLGYGAKAALIILTNIVFFIWYKRVLVDEESVLFFWLGHLFIMFVLIFLSLGGFFGKEDRDRKANAFLFLIGIVTVYLAGSLVGTYILLPF